MNVVLVYKDGRVVTPESPSILEGITLDSVLQLARDRGLTVEQRRVTLAEWQEGVASGEITEVFACGTAAVITPIAQLRNNEVTIGDADAPAGELTMSLREELTDIQYGRRPDRHGWLTRLDA
jgi:branched-chain amino acid aminotransferase